MKHHATYLLAALLHLKYVIKEQIESITERTIVSNFIDATIAHSRHFILDAKIT